MEQKIYGRWKSYEEMRDDWFYGEQHPDLASFPTEDELLFASYGGGSYEGDATVVYSREGRLYENNGSHCSCYGLEGQWKPEETTLAALAAKGKKEEGSYYYFLSDHDGEAYIAYWKMIDALLATTVC